MTHFYRNKAGNKIIGVDNGMVEKYDLLFTRDEDSIIGVDLAEGDDETTRVTIDEKGNLRPVTEEEADVEEDDDQEEDESEEISPLNRPLKHTITPTVDDPVEERREKNKQLQQRFGNTCVNAIVRMREEGATLDDIIEKRPFGTKGMLVDDIEEIMDNWTELDN